MDKSETGRGLSDGTKDCGHSSSEEREFGSNEVLDDEDRSSFSHLYLMYVPKNVLSLKGIAANKLVTIHNNDL